VQINSGNIGTASIDTYVEQAAARFEFDSTLETLVQNSYDGGDLSTILSTLETKSVVESGKSILVLNETCGYGVIHIKDSSGEI
jgi:hypothetical protein